MNGWCTISDPKHIQNIITCAYGEETVPTKPVATPGVARTVLTEDDERVLDSATAFAYRSGVGSAVFLAGDVEVLSYTTQELAKRLHEPREIDFQDLKRLARWLVGHEDIAVGNFVNEQTIQQYRSGGVLDLEGWHDSDWAGSKDDRRSTSGLRSECGGFRLSHYSSTQPGLPTLSSGEAELRSKTKASCELVYQQGVLAEMGVQVRILMKSRLLCSESERDQTWTWQAEAFSHQ